MSETAQALGTIIGGGLLVIILGWILALVHAQAKRIHRIESQLNITEKVTKEKE